MVRRIFQYIFLGLCLNVFAIEEPLPNLHVCTVGCYPEKTYRKVMYRLFDSANRYGVDVHHLGMNQKWKGNGTKINMVLDYVRKLPKEDVILFTDGCDVFYQAGKEEILQKFLSFNALVVFSAEKNCYPDESLIDRFPKYETPFRYLNSGGYIGYVGEIRKMLEELVVTLPKKLNRDDQGPFSRYFLEHQDIYALDRNCEIFVCLYGSRANDFQYEEDIARFKSSITSSYPSIFHGNGGVGKKVFIELYDTFVKKGL